MTGNPECGRMREVLTECADRLNNLDTMLDVRDPGYDEQTSVLSGALDSMEKEYDERPINCGAETDIYSWYGCTLCKFYVKF